MDSILNLSEGTWGDGCANCGVGMTGSVMEKLESSPMFVSVCCIVSFLTRGEAFIVGEKEREGKKNERQKIKSLVMPPFFFSGCFILFTPYIRLQGFVPAHD
jgi:hypothetical protein